ncbi:MAG: hypothetical protein MUE45_03565 [Methanoregulaceae archaeon]|jgi:hypothetical protein|nr:hypothetical protein [Methanoregulaceae archaeon]MCU0628556.1 hypothetical protein [Methanoregulaceae archaeon]
MIREILLGAGITYLIILAIQVIQRPSVATGALAAGSVIMIAAGIYWYGSHEGVHKWEIIMLWSAIFLFVIYGILKFSGVL